jgi:hypothetical protein
MNQLFELFKGVLHQYLKHNNINLNPEERAATTERVKTNWERYVKKIVETAHSDSEAASFGLKTKRPTQFQLQAARISMEHGLVLFAKFAVTGVETIDEIK